MVKGISRQVIVVQSPDPKLFEQAIFILREDAVGNGGITDEALLKEAKHLIASSVPQGRKFSSYGIVWACGGAILTALAWALTILL